MANTRRRALQRRVMQANNGGDKMLGQVLELMKVFEPDHPEYLPLLQAIGTTVIMAQAMLGDFFNHAWGRRPPEFPELSQADPE